MRLRPDLEMPYTAQGRIEAEVSDGLCSFGPSRIPMNLAGETRSALPWNRVSDLWLPIPRLDFQQHLFASP